MMCKLEQNAVDIGVDTVTDTDISLAFFYRNYLKRSCKSEFR